jgi:hypothetical protein
VVIVLIVPIVVTVPKISASANAEGSAMIVPSSASAMIEAAADVPIAGHRARSGNTLRRR